MVRPLLPGPCVQLLGAAPLQPDGRQRAVGGRAHQRRLDVDLAALTLLTYASFGIIPAVVSIFTDDPSPGTLPGRMTLGARFYGFPTRATPTSPWASRRRSSTGQRWIHPGVPVIVTVDELMDQGDGHWSSEHYKMLIGYDDDAKLRYTDDDGNEHTSTGAFYFQNWGGQGETRGDPDVLDPDLRENHTDYNDVPIGNEADSYTVFWRRRGRQGASRPSATLTGACRSIPWTSSRCTPRILMRDRLQGRTRPANLPRRRSGGHHFMQQAVCCFGDADCGRARSCGTHAGQVGPAAERVDLAREQGRPAEAGLQ